MRIAINGAGIAGPTLAYWLRKSGHEVLLIEAAPQLRTGGYIIDFWGVGYPRSAVGIGFRNLVTRLMGIPIVSDYFIGRDLRDDIELPDYAF